MGSVAQSVERVAVNHKVAGAIPARTDNNGQRIVYDLLQYD